MPGCLPPKDKSTLNAERYRSVKQTKLTLKRARRLNEYIRINIIKKHTIFRNYAKLFVHGMFCVYYFCTNQTKKTVHGRTTIGSGSDYKPIS